MSPLSPEGGDNDQRYYGELRSQISSPELQSQFDESKKKIEAFIEEVYPKIPEDISTTYIFGTLAAKLAEAKYSEEFENPASREEVRGKINQETIRLLNTGVVNFLLDLNDTFEVINSGDEYYLYDRDGEQLRFDEKGIPSKYVYKFTSLNEDDGQKGCETLSMAYKAKFADPQQTAEEN